MRSIRPCRRSGEALNGGYKSSGHRLYSIGGKDPGLLLMANGVERGFEDLQSAHDDVQIRAVDGFHLQNHVLPQYFGHGLW